MAKTQEEIQEMVDRVLEALENDGWPRKPATERFLKAQCYKVGLEARLEGAGVKYVPLQTVRLLNVLQNEGIASDEQMQAVTITDFMQWPNVGKKSWALFCVWREALFGRPEGPVTPETMREALRRIATEAWTISEARAIAAAAVKEQDG